ncbi:MAG: tRNA uridine-5-carboxymethylaminomethyl(34) synthesis GTPase MnmE [Bacilli bacterium]|nr:tRNA uridine-5-carboxymethylaminomethyl(34) synthesis GTPase MnmE [Bacilli bacterium]
MEDTIAAISTALGVGAISIVRVSGPKAIEIVNNIFTKDISEVKTHTIHYGFIVDKNEKVDEVLVSVMRGPRTFTTEDIVEINTHGGINTTNKVLEILLVNGCRLATPGEFTKRAFLNGRIDLTEAEGVMDLINSETDVARKMALNQVNGNVSSMISGLREKLAAIISNIEVNIDYPEYDDIKVMTIDDIKKQINIIEKEIKKILDESDNGEILKNGIKTAIIGKPNVGKSSLLNKLIGEEKAIVTNVKGTTRDSVEATVNLDNIVLNLIDTAGIRDTADLVESIGVSKSIELIDEADLILFVLNYNEVLSDEDLAILDKLENKNYITIINKIDLAKKIDDRKLKNKIYVSALSGENIDSVKNKIKELFNLDKIKTSDLTYLTSARSKAILVKVLDSVNDIKQAINDNMPIDMLEIDLKNIWNDLGSIIGENYDEELLDQLFSRFCVGK